MNNSIRPYLYDAANLIRSNVSLLLIPTIIVFAPYLFLIISNQAFGNTLSIFSLVLLFVIYPLIYGKFIAIITGVRKVTWRQLFGLHWWNFFLVKLVLHIPILFLIFIASLFDLDIKRLEGVTSVVLDILAIYIYPIVFMTYQRLASIPLGIKCLIGNFTFSIPLIILIILPILVELLPRNPATYSEISAFYLLFALPQWIFAVVIDFTVFITASLILKDKLYRI